MNHSIANTTGNWEGTRGWVRQPNNRGSLDIIISCSITIFLCAWTSICVNVPSPEHGVWEIFRDRWHMLCLGGLGPEFVVLISIGQFCMARASVQAFAKTKHQSWTMKHAFFADMGGIHLQFPNTKSFPVNGKQLHFLVTNGYIVYPRISAEDIDDKNKANGLARTICTIQILWFTLSTLSRPIAHYAITTLELTTLAYILCTLATLFFWRCKPMDVRTPITLECSTPLERICDRRGRTAAEPYYYTPLDFISREEWIATRLWTYYVNLLRQMHLIHTYKRSLPIRHFSSFYIPLPTRPLLFTMLAIAFAYTGIFIAGWNLHYPTESELILWRTCTLGTMIITVIGSLFEVTMMFVQYRRRHTISALIHNPDIEIMPLDPVGRPSHPSGKPTKLQVTLQNIRNNTPEKDPHFDIPIRSLIVTTPICALYVIFRGFILLEDVISFRELPASTFVTINWSTHVPHF
ncbi:hypothetical protein BU26DRAFT_533233 [Trematosphaeria pertusa]|uniref:Uncharacterized protein n=1 Tax=Trematosphaeria pertusa TaxID=390896 RepID=A0A6A6I533_9PLEO|nr:uncharacterized protein BU26DRAFT_533233 [Trematosphaeria pertusa]KAF2245148.1 hypothetical protein BU26DRAFT_533233 [Trematosphaeria pertusa]